MSYDISFRVKVEGMEYWVPVGSQEANVTWNVCDIIRTSTGLEWKNEENNGLCVDVIPCIEQGLYNLKHYPARYKKYEAKNGWGTVEGTIRFFEQIIRDWHWFLCCFEELENIATFWIT